MSNLLLVVACLALGALLRRVPAFPPDTAKVLNAFVLYVALPAQVLAKMRGVELTAEALLPASMAWLQFGFVGLAVAAVGALAGWTREVRAALVLTAGVANTSFVGWPMVEALIGPAGLPDAILCDQLGSFVVVSTAGLAVAAWGSGERLTPGAVAGAALRFPALGALVLALALGDAAVPPAVDQVFERLGATLTPLALASVGFQLQPSVERSWGPLATGLGLKLVAAPAALLATYTAIGVRPGVPLRVAILEAAMPPMITGAILAAERGLAPALAHRMVGVGVPVGLVTAWGWSLVLERWAA